MKSHESQTLHGTFYFVAAIFVAVGTNSNALNVMHQDNSTHIVERAIKLALHEVKMIKATHFKSVQERRFPDMTINIDPHNLQITFHGKKSDVIAAEKVMHELVDSMKYTYLDMSVPLLRLFGGDVMAAQLLRQFGRRNICAVCTTFEDIKLGVFAFTDGDLKEAIAVIKSELVDIHIDIAHTPEKEQWTMLREQLLSRNKGLLEITVSDSRITVSGAVKPVEQAAREIRETVDRWTGWCKVERLCVTTVLPASCLDIISVIDKL